jgi:accessory colonization factor AcfC
MPYAERHVIPVTTAADGSATVYSPVVTGPVSAIHYVKTDFANGVDFSITVEATGQNLWVETNVDAAKVVAPRQPTHDQAGAALLYAAAGLPVEAPIHLANDRVKIVIASGGNVKTGTFHIVIG